MYEYSYLYSDIIYLLTVFDYTQGCQVDLENLENLEKGQKVAKDLEKTLKNDSNQGWTLKNEKISGGP